MSIYVLVHGAWHGKWCWEKVVPILEKEGHHVLALDLPGHGDNVGNFKDISLKVYVDYVIDCINKILNDNLQSDKKVILIGHSMGGITISQVAEIIPDKIAQLVFVAAFVPKDNEFLTQIAKRSSHPGISPEMILDLENSCIHLRKSPIIADLLYSKCDPADAQRALSLLEDEPSLPSMDKVKLTKENFGSVPKVYIECTLDVVVFPEDQRAMYQSIDCKVVSLSSDHSPFYSTLIPFTEALLNLSV